MAGHGRIRKGIGGYGQTREDMGGYRRRWKVW